MTASFPGRTSLRRNGAGTAARCLAAAAVLALLPALSAPADTFRFSADRMESVTAEGREYARLSGNARLQADDLVITADAIELSGKDWRFARCQGNVTASDEEQGIRITTELLVYDRRTRVSRLEGDSVLEDFRNRVVLKAFWMENDDKRKLVSARIGVRVFKDKTSARSSTLTYRREDQLLELAGTARVLRDGDEYRAERILLNLDTDEITLYGGVSGTVVKKKDEESASPAPASGLEGEDGTTLEPEEPPAGEPSPGPAPEEP